MKESSMVAKSEQKQFTLAEAQVIGDKLGISWVEFDVKQFCLGLNTERTDGIYNPVTSFASDDPILIGKIVRAHLNESPDYYTQWAQREKELAHGNKRKHADSSGQG